MSFQKVTSKVVIYAKTKNLEVSHAYYIPYIVTNSTLTNHYPKIDECNKRKNQTLLLQSKRMSNNKKIRYLKKILDIFFKYGAEILCILGVKEKEYLLLGFFC